MDQKSQGNFFFNTELSKNENTDYQNVWDTAEIILRGESK